MQSQDERDAEGFAARKERDGSVKELAGEEITERYEGEELDERCAARRPDERFGRLEKKHDELKQYIEKKHDELKQDRAWGCSPVAAPSSSCCIGLGVL